MRSGDRLAYQDFPKKLAQKLKRIPHRGSGHPSLYDEVNAFSHMRQKVDGLFDGITSDDAKLAKIRSMPWPDRRYVLFFTPRSGSSWLGDLIEKTGHLGNPGEPFNPAIVPRIAIRLQATDMATYIDTLLRARSKNGTFGCEITFRQIHNCFGDMGEMLRLLQPTAFLWLLREDLVAQAVSLSRRQQTQIAHSSISDEAAQAGADSRFTYDRKAIRRSIDSLCWQEERMDELFDTHGLEPFRLSYETATRSRERDLLVAIAQHIGVDLPETGDVEASLTKLKAGKATEFIQRFKDENADYVAFINDRRAPRLARVNDIPASDP
jgi:LPS sulfotransferase NodH